MRDSIAKVSEDARVKITAALQMLSERGNLLLLPHSRAMGQGLFEIRVAHPGGPFRIMYCFRPGRRIVLLHAFVKRTEATAPADLDMAKARKRDIEKGGR